MEEEFDPLQFSDQTDFETQEESDGLLTPSTLSAQEIRSKLPLKRKSVEDLGREIDELPSLLEMASLEAARRGSIVNQIDNLLKETQARAWMSVKDVKNESGKTDTVDTIKAKVEIDEGVLLLREQRIQAELDYEEWRGLSRSLQAKKDMIEMVGQYILRGMLAHS